MTDVTHVTTDLLEQLAWEKGETITIRPDHAELRIGNRIFRSPLPLPAIPAQRRSAE